MHITLFSGSPRKEKGVTHLIAKNFLAGAKKAGVETDYIFLEEKKISHCTGCFACWFKTPGRCVIKDDMQKLLDQYMTSDIVVLASPIYVGSVTGIMKDFIDRMLPIFDPRVKKDDNGHYHHLPRYKSYPDVVVISNGSNPGQSHFEFFRSIFDFMRIVYKMNIIGEIFIGGGPILQGFVPSVEDKVDEYMRLLQNCGEEIVQKRMISKNTQQKLQEPLVPFDQAFEDVNQVIEALIDDLK
jgi:multimeric flavodoxin WrbA